MRPSPYTRAISGWPWACAAACTLLVAGAGVAQDRPVRSATDDQMRSAFLYQLAQYVTWPQEKSGEPLRFCVLGDDQLADMLEPVLRGKSIQGRPVVTSKLGGSGQLTGCHVAFLGLARRKQVQELLARWSYPPILLVGETDGFAEMGGMVGLKIDAGRVSIEINLNTCRRAGLDVRSQLLRLARIVPGDGNKP